MPNIIIKYGQYEKRLDAEDYSVAAVDENGIVTANGVGETLLNAVSGDGGFKAEILVKVVENLEEPPEKSSDAAGKTESSEDMSPPVNQSGSEDERDTSQSDGTAGSESAVDTGDCSNIWLYFVLLQLSIAGAGIFFIFRKRYESHENNTSD